MTIEQLMNMITDLSNRVNALENDRSPDSIHNKIELYATTLEEMTHKIAEQEARLNAMDGNDSVIEKFSDQELNKWYKTSGLNCKDVQGFISLALGEDITPKDANDFLNGKFGDEKLKSKVGKWFRTRTIKYNSERGIN